MISRSQASASSALSRSSKLRDVAVEDWGSLPFGMGSEASLMSGAADRRTTVVKTSQPNDNEYRSNWREQGGREPRRNV